MATKHTSVAQIKDNEKREERSHDSAIFIKFLCGALEVLWFFQRGLEAVGRCLSGL